MGDTQHSAALAKGRGRNGSFGVRSFLHELAEVDMDAPTFEEVYGTCHYGKGTPVDAPSHYK